jgi:hypothetical protein
MMRWHRGASSRRCLVGAASHEVIGVWQMQLVAIGSSSASVAGQ